MEKRERLVEQWRALKQNTKSKEAYVLGGWLEEDGAIVGKYWEHTRPQEQAVATQDRVFCVLDFEQAKEEIGSESATNDEELSTLLGEDAEHHTMSTFMLYDPVQLQPQIIDDTISPTVDACDSFGSLLQLPPHRHHSEKTHIMSNLDTRQEIRRGATPSRNRVAGPHGDYTQMGAIHQYMSPKLPYLKEQDNLTADFIYFSFRRGFLDSNNFITNNLLGYRREIEELPGCASLVQCYPVGFSDACILIICLLLLLLPSFCLH